eukprot:m.46347 g.46347  ORF g.46347 m.46347 type:complete len:334 (+) comp10363_c0_seq1:43-1044(+)
MPPLSFRVQCNMILKLFAAFILASLAEAKDDFCPRICVFGGFEVPISNGCDSRETGVDSRYQCYDGISWKYGEAKMVTNKCITSVYFKGAFYAFEKQGNGAAVFDGNKWIPLKSFVERYYPGVAVYNDEIYVIGGDTAMVQSFNGASWTTRAPLPEPIRYHGCACTYKNKLYSLGGTTGGARGSVLPTRVDMYDGTSWLPASTELPVGMEYCSCTVYNDNLLVYGTHYTNNVGRETAVYSYDGEHWTNMDGSIYPFGYTGVNAWLGATLVTFRAPNSEAEKVYAIGGTSQAGGPHSRVISLTGTVWESEHAMKNPEFLAGVATCSGSDNSSWW